jgi:hypothetical protein
VPDVAFFSAEKASVLSLDDVTCGFCHWRLSSLNPQKRQERIAKNILI